VARKSFNKAAASPDKLDRMLLREVGRAAPRNHRIAELAEAGANLDVRDRKGNTPLLLAVRNGHADAVRLLAVLGAKLEVADREGRTPLYHAICCGGEKIRDILLEFGAPAGCAGSSNERWDDFIWDLERSFEARQRTRTNFRVLSPLRLKSRVRKPSKY
jgi:ankyrin repeat protein